MYVASLDFSQVVDFLRTRREIEKEREKKEEEEQK